MKKLFALALVLAMVLTCAAALAEDYTIYLITMDLEDMHWVSVDEGAQAAVKEATDAGLSMYGLAPPPARTMPPRSSASTTLTLTTQT